MLAILFTFEFNVIFFQSDFQYSLQYCYIETYVYCRSKLVKGIM